MSSFWDPCPNLPPCPHYAWVHDIEEPGDPFPTCCGDGCGCGHVQGPMPKGVLPSWASFWDRVPDISIRRGGLRFPPSSILNELP